MSCPPPAPPWSQTPDLYQYRIFGLIGVPASLTGSDGFFYNPSPRELLPYPSHSAKCLTCLSFAESLVVKQGLSLPCSSSRCLLLLPLPQQQWIFVRDPEQEYSLLLQQYMALPLYECRAWGADWVLCPCTTRQVWPRFPAFFLAFEFMVKTCGNSCWVSVDSMYVCDPLPFHPVSVAHTQAVRMCIACFPCFHGKVWYHCPRREMVHLSQVSWEELVLPRI